MRKAFIILTGVLFTFLFTDCEQFHANMEDYLGYWSAEVTLARYSIDKPQQTNGEGVLYISSATDVTITIKLNNPKRVKLVTPTSSADAGKVIRFPGFKPNDQPEYGDTKDYTLKQTANDELELTYHSAFLKKHEWGKSDISPQITLIAEDGRVFKQTFTVKLKVNTPPPLPVFTVAKTKSAGTSAYFVLCIRVPEMNMAVEGGLLHKDLARIEVNGTPYTFSVNEAEHTFVKPEADVFITQFAVERLSELADDAVPADSRWVLYYKTDVEVKEGAAKKDYAIKLVDEKGLVSGIVKASTKPNKAETEIVSITKGRKISGSGSETDPFIIAVAANSEGAELAISSATANTMVHCTCTDTSGGSVTRYNGNPVTVPLPLNGAGEKKYKLEYYTDGEGFAATPVKTVYYKVVEEHTVTFNVVGGNGNLEGKYGSDQQTATTSPVTLTVPHGYSVIFTATPTDPTHYKVGDWTCTPSEGFTGASGQSSATLTVTANTIVSVQFVQLNALNLSKLEIHGRDASAGSVTLPYTITQVAKSNVTLEFSGYSTIPFTVTSSPPLPLTLMPGAPKDITITVAANPGNYPEWSKTVHITRAKNNVAKLQSFTLNGETKTAASDGSFAGEYEVASKQAEVKDFIFDADSTGATASVNHAGNQTIPAGTGGQFTITVKAQNGTETQTITFTVKRKKYDVNYSVDGVGGKIKTSSGTAVTSGSTKVEYGESISFTAVPNTANGYEVKEWTVNSNVVSGYTSTSYELPDVTGDKDVKVKFKKTVYNVTFSVDGGHGTISATPQDGSASSTSPVSVEHEKKVTFTAVPDTGYEVKEWTVDGNVVSGNTSRSYELSAVTEAKAVTVKFYQSEIDDTAPMAWSALLNAVRNAPANATIEINGEINATSTSGNNGEIVINKNLTIKGKKTDGSDTLNAITLSRIFKVETGNTLTLENITLKNGGKIPATEDGGGIYSAGTLMLKNTTIEGCGATNGGGILVKEGGKAELKNCTVKACEAAEKGGGIYSLGEVTLDASTIGGSSASDGNKAKRGGGISLEKGTIDVSAGSFIQHNQTVGSSGIEAGGGGIFIRYGKLTLRGTVSDNTALNGTAFVLGGGVYVGAQGEFIMETGATISGNTSKCGGGVYIDVVSAGAGAFTMKGGTISGCKAGDSAFSDAQGGGVYIKADGTKQGIFTMEGGSITGCTAEATSASGGGVYADSKAVFKMSGGAVITPSTQTNTSTLKYNDVYLDGPASDNAKITVNGTLTGTAPVACITVDNDNYKPFTKVLDGNITTGSPKNYTKFTVTSKVIEDGIAEIWKIKANGNLEKSQYIDVRYDKLAYYLSSTYASSHAVEGINYIKITGTIPADDLRDYIYPSSGGRLAKTIQYAHKKVALKLPDSIPELTTMYNCFTKCEYLVSLEKIPSGVTSMAECFKGCKNLTKAPVIPDSVKDMEHCFDGCTALTQAPTIHPGVTNIKWCFQDCKALIRAPDIPQGVTDIYSCFQGCENLTQVPNIPSSVTGMGQCFKYCAALTDGPDISSNVEDMYQCFEGCTNLRGLKLMCNYNDQGTYFEDVFKGCSKLKNGGIKVPQNQLQAYQDHAGKMGVTDPDKFVGF